MAQHTVGFIGFGNMAQAMAKGFLQAGVLEGAQIAACAKRWEKLEKTAGELGVIPCKDAVEVLERSDILILAVKPYLIETVLAPIREKLAGKVLLSVAAGWPFQRFEEVLPAPRRAVVEEIKQAMLSQGALGACMSGTGPTVFGIFAGETEAEAAWRSLKGSYDETFLTHSV